MIFPSHFVLAFFQTLIKEEKKKLWVDLFASLASQAEFRFETDFEMSVDYKNDQTAAFSLTKKTNDKDNYDILS